MKKAFTLLEMVFVIVIIGIIATTVLSRTNSNSLREAALQVLSDIRYTQHLAMVDDKFNSTDSQWYRDMWQIQFNKNVDTILWPYTIYCDTTRSSNANSDNEIAVNPLDKSKFMTGGSSGYASEAKDNHKRTKNMALGDKYNITKVAISGCGSTALRITFDHLGRPISGNPNTSSSALGRVIKGTDCKITLTHSSGDTIVIQIERETGYARILP